MRPRVTIAVAILLALCGHARGDEFPFDGYISSPEADIACGPGKRFYVTERLPRGTKVEVYREDAAGWLAIRPPAGSFCWVPADQIERLDAATGKVIATSECWIGTHVEQVQEHKSQVTLKAHELVEVLGERTIADDGGPAKWLKIAPPAGEFRYISSQNVSREPVPAEERAKGLGTKEAGTADREQSPKPEPERFELSGPAMSVQDIEDVRDRMAAIKENLAELARRSAAQSPVQPAQFRSSADATVGKNAKDQTLSPDGFVARKRRPSGQLPPGATSAATGKQPPPFARPKLDPPAHLADNSGSPVSGKALAAGLGAQPERQRAIASEEVAQQLEQVELELSLMLSQDKSTWNLAALRQRVEQLVESGATPTDRGTARLALEKINQIEATFDVADYGPIVTSPPPPAAAESPRGTSPADPRYDAEGWLKPVVSRSKPAAPYAVVDAEGKPLCFVTPAPGLNLNRYLNQQVGVYGRRGYLEDLKKPHVLAERVIALERHLR